MTQRSEKRHDRSKGNDTGHAFTARSSAKLMGLLLFVALFLFARPCLATEKKKILSFGGNGMIGAATLLLLIEDGSYDIYLVSRGTWHFDTQELIQPHVTTIVCDRADPLQSCEDLMSVVQTIDEFYAVLDFSGFEPTWIENAVSVLTNKVRVYIYVSTDSVYEVSEGAEEDIDLNRLGKLTSKMLESQAVRPKDVEVRERLNQMDDYGDEKLAGEEVLQQQTNFPFVFLRFADVVGPRDGTERYILYHIWIKYSQAIGIPLSVPDDVANMTTSVTYVQDGALAILLAMNRKEAWNEAYNIACDEKFNVIFGIKSIASALGIDEIEVNVVPSEEGFAAYPSVRRGPMDISKARDALRFEPTPMEEVFRKTAEWYERVFTTDEILREYMLEEFIADVLEEGDDDSIQRLLQAVGQELGVSYDYNENEGDDDLSEL